MHPGSPVRILHVVNPIVASPTSDLRIAQPVTFASMRRAITSTDPGVARITIAATVYDEDAEAVPADVEELPRLQRSILDLRDFDHRRKLPLIADILERAATRHDDADLVVYSNVDIAVQPYFYEFLATGFGRGTDGMVINRRTISTRATDPAELVTMYSETGTEHPGRDCFVYTPTAYEQFDLGHVIIGAGDIGRVLLWNIAARAGRFHWFKDRHLTFHLGDDRAWDRTEMAPYHEHNNDEARVIFARLESELGPLHDREPWCELLPRKAGYWDEWRRSIEDPPGPFRRAKGRVGRWVRDRDPRRAPW